MANAEDSCNGLKSLILQVFTGRWFAAFASMLIMAVSGALYMFGLYSNTIKATLGYDQTTLNLLSFFKDLGGQVGVIAGLVSEVAPPWVVLFIGVVMNFFGYFMIWLSVSDRIAKPSVWQMCLYIAIGANSQAFANTGALVTNVKNFPESRGSVIGLLKGYVGLSGAIMAQLYHAFYGDDTESLILLIAWLPAAVSLVFLRIVRYMKVTRQTNELKVWYKLLYVSLGLAGFLLILIILQSKFKFTRVSSVGSGTVVIIMLILPLAIVIVEEAKLWRSKRDSLTNSSQMTKVVTGNPSAPQCNEDPDQVLAKPVSCMKDIFKPPERGEDFTIPQAIFSIDNLIIFFAIASGLGGTITAIDNLGQIAKSLGYPNHSITSFISLVSIWNFLGRAVAGYASESLLTKYKCPRPLLFTVVLLFSSVGHILIAFAVPNSLYPASIIIGFCYGAQCCLMFTIISDIFGLKYYATLLNVGALASPLGAYLFNVRVAGNLYDKEALKQMKALGRTRKPGEDLNCTGGQCYRMAFIIITMATLSACIVSSILVVRTRKFYQGDIYKKYREEPQTDTVTNEGAELGSIPSVNQPNKKIQEDK